MNYSSAVDLGYTSEDMDNLPEGSTLSIMPPTREYMRDPMWFDPIGRDPVRARKVFKKAPGDEGYDREWMKAKLAEIMEEWPRNGPAIYEKAAREGRIYAVEVLIELGVKSDPATMKNGTLDGNEVGGTNSTSEMHIDDDQLEDDEPLLEPEHGYLAAIFEGHLDIAKLMVERGGVPVDYADEDGLIAIAYTCAKGHFKILRWLLDNAATVTLDREGARVGDLASAVKGGHIEIVKMFLSDPQIIAAGQNIELSHLGLAASGLAADKNPEMTRFVLQSNCYSTEDANAGLEGHPSALSDDQRRSIEDSLPHAARTGSVERVKLLLQNLTPIGSDGTLESLRLSDNLTTIVYNSTDEALDDEDNPELFELLWDTVLHHPPKSEQAYGIQSHFHTTAMGRIGTVKLLVEKYGVDVNHVSHKLFCTPLGKCTIASANPLPDGLEVVEYLCRRPELDMGLANGEYCNDDTALAYVIQQGQEEIVRLLLKHGGPVDDVSAELHEQCEGVESEEKVRVHVLSRHDEYRKPVRLAMKHEKGSAEGSAEVPRERFT